MFTATINTYGHNGLDGEAVESVLLRLLRQLNQPVVITIHND
ncbi:cation-transporting P-type ATPase [Anabaena subtropica]